MAAVIETGHERYVHHMVGYNCYGEMPKTLATSSGDEDMPLGKCTTALFFWMHGASVRRH